MEIMGQLNDVVTKPALADMMNSFVDITIIAELIKSE